MNVGLALRNTSKGQIKYDKYWAQEGRTKEILDDISRYSSKVALSVSPKALDLINHEHHDDLHTELIIPKIAQSNSTKVENISECNPSDVYLYELQSETEFPILEYEKNRRKQIEEVFNNKKAEYENHTLELLQQKQQEYLWSKRNKELDAKRKAASLQKMEEDMIKEAKEREKLKNEHYQSHVKKMSAKVLEAEIKQKKLEEVLKKRELEQMEFKSQLDSCYQEVEALANKCIEKLNGCNNLDHLQLSLEERMHQLSNLLHPFVAIKEVAKTKPLTIEDIMTANQHVQAGLIAFNDVVNDIEQAKIKAAIVQSPHPVAFSFKECLKDRETVINPSDKVPNSQVKPSGVDTQSFDLQEPNKIQHIADNVKKPKGESKKLLCQFIAPDSIEDYYKIMENLKHVETLVEGLKKDSKNKKYRFELQKAINVPINSLTSNSGLQVKGKVNKLLSILSGKAAEVQGRDMSSNSVVFNFCSNLIAKQFVEQGDSQISAQHSTAFPIAMALLGVWSKRPEVGALVRAHFYRVCPYLVPYYPPREEGQTDKEYYEMLGYYFDDEGKMEEKHKFLNRISGYMRLYAALIVSTLPSNSSTPHPHALPWGWKWLSRTLNMDPRLDVTATLIFDFLEVAGHALQKAYGKQFKKMLHILCKDYFQKIRQVSSGGSDGPIERLEIFLQQTVKKGHIDPPNGVLSASFWSS